MTCLKRETGGDIPSPRLFRLQQRTACGLRIFYSCLSQVPIEYSRNTSHEGQLAAYHEGQLAAYHEVRFRAAVAEIYGDRLSVSCCSVRVRATVRNRIPITTLPSSSKARAPSARRASVLPCYPHGYSSRHRRGLLPRHRYCRNIWPSHGFMHELRKHGLDL